jgi:hypothetical protein
MNRDPARDLVAPHLSPGERIVWRQAARPWPLALRRLPGLVFACVWAGFAWTWTAIALSAMAPALFGGDFSGVFTAIPIMFIVFGAFFSAIGAGIVWSALRDVAASWSTHYALTNQRVLIVDRGGAESFEAGAFAQMSRSAAALHFAWGPMGRGGAGYSASLIGLDDPARVQALIRNTLMRA